MADRPIKAEVETFDKGKLRKTSTSERVVLPSKEDIEQEKKEEKAKK